MNDDTRPLRREGAEPVDEGTGSYPTMPPVDTVDPDADSDPDADADTDADTDTDTDTEHGAEAGSGWAGAAHAAEDDIGNDEKRSR